MAGSCSLNKARPSFFLLLQVKCLEIEQFRNPDHHLAHITQANNTMVSYAAPENLRGIP